MIALALCKQAEGEVVNIGSGREWSIEETAKILMEVTGCEVPILCDEDRIRPEKSEVNRLLADNTKIQKLTDWKSQVSFQAGLGATADWIGRNLQYFNVERYTI